MTDDEAIKRVSVNIYNEDNSSFLSPCGSTPGGSSLDVDEYAFTCSIDTTEFEDGIYTLRGSGRDTSDNIRTVSQKVIFDNTNPIMTIDTPFAGIIVKDEIEISGTAIEEMSGIVDDMVQVHFRKLKDNGKCGSFANTLNVEVVNGQWLENFDTNTLDDGDYCITGLISDNAGNTNGGGVHVKFITIDNTGPTVTIKDSSIGNGIDVFQSVSFKLFDQYKVDKVEINGILKELSNNKWSDLNNVEPGKFGAVEGLNTLVIYDVAGNTTTFEFILESEDDVENVKDDTDVINEVPVIILAGSTEVFIIVGNDFTEPGYTAIDSEDGNITSSVIISGDIVDTDTVGQYVVTYDVSDSGGANAVQRTRVVNVIDSGISGGGITTSSFGGGEVLGAEIGTNSCEVLINNYLYPNQSNDSFEVAKLQSFLKINGFNNEINGVFASGTELAVRDFQLDYSSEVLQPWVDLGLLSSGQTTGVVGKTTKWKINNLHCLGSESYPTLP